MARFIALVILFAAAGSSLAGPTVLITGSNRGIGLEFARQYSESGATVIATCRNPATADDLRQLAEGNENVRILQLDVTNAIHVAKVTESLAEEPIDILINNAGLIDFSPSSEFGQMDYDLVGRMIAVNALGPVRVAEALVKNVAASDQKKIINITSSAGSIGAINRPGFLGYRASKAALNSMMRNLSLQLAGQGIVVGLINPGTVDTRGILDMTMETAPPELKPAVQMIAAGQLKMQRTPDAVKNLIGIISGMTAEDSGRFIDHTRETLPW